MNLTRAVWRKSSRSSQGPSCVEVADNLPGIVAVRDSKNPTGPALTFPSFEWATFIEEVRAGRFDVR